MFLHYCKVLFLKQSRNEKRSGCSLTCFGVDRKVWLAMEDTVHHSSTVAIGGVIRICGRHLCHVRPWGWGREGELMLLVFSWDSNPNALGFIGTSASAQPSHGTLMNDESQPIGPQPIPSRVPSERTGLQRMIGSDFFPPLVCFDLANLSNTRWATTEWTMPLLRKQKAIARRLLGWHYSRLLLEEVQNNYMLGLWLIRFN